MSNSQILDDFRYCAEAFTGDSKIQADADLRQFAACLIGAHISPPAQKPASVPGGSGAGLVGNHSPNVSTWHQISEFLAVQQLALLGLRMLS